MKRETIWIQLNSFAVLILFALSAQLGYAESIKGNLEIQTDLPAPVVQFTGKPAEQFWHYIIQSGTQVFKCANKKAVRSNTMICLQKKQSEYECFSKVVFGGDLIPDDDQCPQPSVIGVGN